MLDTTITTTTNSSLPQMNQEPLGNLPEMPLELLLKSKKDSNSSTTKWLLRTMLMMSLLLTPRNGTMLLPKLTWRTEELLHSRLSLTPDLIPCTLKNLNQMMISFIAIPPELRDVLPLLNNQMMTSPTAILLELKDASLLPKKLNQTMNSLIAILLVPEDASLLLNKLNQTMNSHIAILLEPRDALPFLLNTKPQWNHMPLKLPPLRNILILLPMPPLSKLSTIKLTPLLWIKPLLHLRLPLINLTIKLRTTLNSIESNVRCLSYVTGSKTMILL